LHTVLIVIMIVKDASVDTAASLAVPEAIQIQEEETTFTLSLGGVEFGFVPDQNNQKGSVAFESMASNETILQLKAFAGFLRVSRLSLENNLSFRLSLSGGVDMGFQLLGSGDLDLPLTLTTGSNGSITLESLGSNEVRFCLRCYDRCLARDILHVDSLISQ
jgi:predicted alpha/beta hydrolase